MNILRNFPRFHGADFKHGFADMGGFAHQRRMAVVGEKQHEFTGCNLQPSFGRAIKKFDVFFFVVAQAVFQTATVCLAIAFHAANGHLNIDVFQMRFRLRGFACAHRLIADNQTDIGIRARVLAVWQRLKIKALQHGKGIGEIGVQGGIAGSVGDGVGNHDGREWRECFVQRTA